MSQIQLPQERIVEWPAYHTVDLPWAASKYEPNNMTAFRCDAIAERHHFDTFRTFVRSLFPFDVELVSRYIGIWDENSVSDRDADYCQGFPHRHNNDLCAISVILQEPMSGGWSTLITDDGQELMTSPQEGFGVLIGGREEHGVQRVYGPVPRIAMIAQFDRVRP